MDPAVWLYDNQTSAQTLPPPVPTDSDHIRSAPALIPGIQLVRDG